MSLDTSLLRAGSGAGLGLDPEVADFSWAFTQDGLDELAVGPDLDELASDVDVDDLAAVVTANGEDLPVDAHDPVGGDSAVDPLAVAVTAVLGIGDLGRDGVSGGGAARLEPFDGGQHPEGLVGAVGVVVGHEAVQRRLGLFQAGEDPAGKELRPQRPVEPLDLAGGGWRTDPVRR